MPSIGGTGIGCSTGGTSIGGAPAIRREGGILIKLMYMIHIYMYCYGQAHRLQFLYTRMALYKH